MDGWGKEVDKKRSAIAQAHTPNVDAYYTNYPNTTLITYGEEVGLPDGQMGNSEVGHMNIGAGRIVYQDFMRINLAIRDNHIATNENWLNLLNYAKDHNKPLHLMGLFSTGGVHSHLNHLIALCKHAASYGVSQIYVHAFTDGRDCSPNAAKNDIAFFENEVKDLPCRIVSMVGRYYAMDRDNRWERVKKAYDLIVKGEGESFENAQKAIETAYANKLTDEFLLPCIIGEKIHIMPNDAVLCFNFRTDRCREITEVLTLENKPEFDMHTIPLQYVTMTRYKDTFTHIPVLFDKDNLKNTLGEVIASNHKTQCRIAETEKYPHVTFFFSGGREKLFPNEQRKVIASPKVATYDLQPEMSAYEVKDNVIQIIEKDTPDFIVLNFANTDMVGHTGIFSAAMKAAETVDFCVNEVIQTALSKNYSILLTADHGNADIMINEDGSPHTAHTKNLVPLFLIQNQTTFSLKAGKLGDLAPTILQLMNIPIPTEMTGKSLLV